MGFELLRQEESIQTIILPALPKEIKVAQGNPHFGELLRHSRPFEMICTCINSISSSTIVVLIVFGDNTRIHF